MKIIPAKNAPYDQISDFLVNNEHIDKHELWEMGYVVAGEEKIVGCFILQQVENDSYWLKQLYIIKDEAGKLPFVLESVLALAKQEQARHVYTHSHQPVVDMLLDALQFNKKDQQPPVDNQSKKSGTWWTYQVS